LEFAVPAQVIFVSKYGWWRKLTRQFCQGNAI